MSLEPLEERALLTTLTFGATPFERDATSGELKVNYETDTNITTDFTITASVNTAGGTLLYSKTVEASSSTVYAGANSITFDAATIENAFPNSSFTLQVNLDAGDVFNGPVTDAFYGMFIDADDIVQVFGDPTKSTAVNTTGSGAPATVNFFENSVQVDTLSSTISGLQVRFTGNTNIFMAGGALTVPVKGYGGSGDDYILTSAGNDTIVSGTGNLTAYGLNGTDVIDASASAGTVNIQGGNGSDTIHGGSGTNTLAGNDGSDTIYGGSGTNSLSGQDATGDTDSDNLYAGGGSNSFVGLDAADTVHWSEAEADGNITSWSGSNADFNVNLSTASSITSNTSNLVVGSKTLSYSSVADLAVTVGAGRSGFILNMSGNASQTMAVSMPGGGTKTLQLKGTSSSDTVSMSSSSSVTINSEAISLSGITSLVILPGAGDDVVTLTSTGANSLPQLRVWAEQAGDILNVNSTAAGSVTSTMTYAVASPFAGYRNVLTVDGSTSTINADNFLQLGIKTKTYSVTGLGQGQHIRVETDSSNTSSDISIYGSVYDLGDAPDGDPRVLLENVSHATLHGGLTSPHYSSGGVDYLVQSEKDVVLVTEESAAGLVVGPETITLHEHKWDPTPTVSYPNGHYIMDHETVPRFVQAADVRSIGDGDWSSPSTWSNSMVPGPGDKVRITAGTTVTFDETLSEEINAIEVAGTLRFKTDVSPLLVDVVLELLVGTIQVLPSGTLQIGTEADPIPANVTAKLTFADLDLEVTDTNQFGRGLLGFGTVDIHGAEVVKSWVRLPDEVLADEDEIVFPLGTDLTGWEVGMSIVFPDSRQPEFDDPTLEAETARANTQTEVAVIASITESSGIWTITLEEPLRNSHRGAYYTTTAYSATGVVGAGNYAVRGAQATYDDPSTIDVESIALVPHVGLLSRNVVIQSANASDSYHSSTGSQALDEQRRGHVLFSGRADVDIQNALFLNLGRTATMRETSAINDTLQVQDLNATTNHIGRYSVHFHHLTGPADAEGDYQFVFKGNSVQGALKWGVTVHHSHFGLIENNIVYDAQGAAFTTEDGSEIGNVFKDNMAVMVHGSFTENIGNSDITTRGDFGRSGSGFWFRRAGNDVIGNVAADTGYAGMVISSYYRTMPAMIPSYPGAAGHDNFEEVTLVEPGVIENNEFYGRLSQGIWLTYALGDNQAPDHPDLTLDYQRVWNTFSGFVGYHFTNVTLDHFLYLADPETTVRTNYGGAGVHIASEYEAWNFHVLNSHIEGAYEGVYFGTMSLWKPGSEPVPNTVEDTYLENRVNVTVQMARDSNGHAIHLKDVEFVDKEFGLNDVNADGLQSKYNIYMRPQIGRHNRNSTAYSYVTVENFDNTTDDFQVYFKEQAATWEWPVNAPSDDNWWRYNAETYLGPPTGGATGVTNEDTWEQYGLAFAGFIAPSSAIDGIGKGIFGLVSDGTTYDISTVPAGTIANVTVPSGTKAMAVFVTPFEDAIVIRDSKIGINYNVIGQLPAGSAVWFRVNSDSPTKSTDMAPPPAGVHTIKIWIADEDDAWTPVADVIGYADAVAVTYTTLANITIAGPSSATPAANEGNNRVFTVRLATTSSSTVTVEFTTENIVGQAVAGTDYTAQSGTLTFTSGQTVQYITVVTTGDGDAEPDETFRVVLSNPTNGGFLQTPAAIGVIVNDDGAPMSAVADERGESSWLVSLLPTANRAELNSIVAGLARLKPAERVAQFQAASNIVRLPTLEERVTQLRAALPAESVLVRAVTKTFEALGHELEEGDDLFAPEDGEFALLE